MLFRSLHTVKQKGLAFHEHLVGTLCITITNFLLIIVDSLNATKSEAPSLSYP